MRGSESRRWCEPDDAKTELTFEVAAVKSVIAAGRTVIPFERCANRT